MGERGPLHETYHLRYMHCASAHGFSPYAGVRCDANDRQGIEQLCRYVTHPAIANERLALEKGLFQQSGSGTDIA